MSYENDETTEPAQRQVARYRCPKGHEFVVPFSVEAEVPQTWDCRSCGAFAARLDSDDTTARAQSRIKPARSHWDMLLERRSIPELEVILQERLDVLRMTGRRKSA